MKSENVVFVEKYCGMCEKIKPITDFTRSTRYKKYGVKPNCRACYCEMSKKSYHKKMARKREIKEKGEAKKSQE
jgi:hypothetical protein